ncbi:tigger transposable element-derived protein 4-like [Ornithodoros turicata]|uniref:tigger transposable element-derived protein 4-like n=1 Tax=Ornithodoros turicata TaxID=34597 RepID=UPI00313870A8
MVHIASFFGQWLREMDRRFVRENRKVLILVDNCPGHGNVSGLSSIRLEFLPPNTTAKLQPMNHGVISRALSFRVKPDKARFYTPIYIKYLKRHYRRSLLQRMLLCMETGKEYQVNLLSAIHLLSYAWDKVSETTIANCFHHAGFVTHSSPTETLAENSVEELPEDDDPNLLSDLKSAGISMDMVAYVNVDDDVATCRDDTMEALIEETCTEKPSETEAEAIEEEG